MKNTGKSATFITICIFLLLGLMISLPTTSFIYAETNDVENRLEDRCNEFTDSEILFGEQDKRITDYADYVFTRFDINYVNKNSALTDEWIFKIIPQELAERHYNEYLHIGNKYGFYFDYDETNNTFFVYLMLHDFNIETSGHIVRRITPLYYEKYSYNTNNKTAALIYNSNMSMYQRYSDIKNVFLKNIAFGGKLYNENNLNVDDEGYDAKTDNGGYFVGGSYLFKGVSTQSGKMNFNADVFKVVVGTIKLTKNLKVSHILTIADLAVSLLNYAYNASNDFRSDITNENDYSFSLSEFEREKQIEKFTMLQKDYVCLLNTPNTNDGLMFGIKSKNYAQSTFYYNFADQTKKWNTGFSGRIKMDIVEEIETDFGSIVSPIISDVESNQYSTSIYKRDRFQLKEETIGQVYVLANNYCPMTFHAPANGTYTFETYGAIQNEFSITNGTINLKPDGINQRLAVNLRAGENFYIDTYNKTNDDGVYEVKVEFTPTEIFIGDTKSLKVNAGETEYFAYYPKNGSGFNYSLTSNGNYVTTVSFNSLTNVLDSVSSNEKTDNAIPYRAVGKYLIGIRNNTNQDVTLGLSLNDTIELETGKVNQLTVGHSGLFKLSAAPFNCPFTIQSSSSSNLTTILMNDKLSVLLDSGISANSKLQYILKANESYYLLIKNQNTYNASTQVDITETPSFLELYQNNLDKPHANMTYGFKTRTTAEYIFTGTGATISVYDNNWREITHQNGKYALSESSIYYIVATGSENTININITFDFTVEKAGNLNASGYRFIRFIPSSTNNYEVEGFSNHIWYDSNLYQKEGKLTANETYYVKLNGQANAAYSISIVLFARPIQMRSDLTLNNGLYVLEIDIPGDYIFSTTKANGANGTFHIQNSEREFVVNNLKIGTEYIGNFGKGKIYIIFLNSSNSTGFRVNRLHANNETNTTLLNGMEHSIEFLPGTDNNFVFQCTESGNYVFKLAYATLDTTFKITVADAQYKIVSTTDLKLETFENDTLNKRYAIKMVLEKDASYYLNVFYEREQKLQANVLLANEVIINNVELNSGNDTVKVIENKNIVDNLTVAMGKIYIVSMPEAQNANWQISSNTTSGIAQKIEDKLIINFDTSKENAAIHLVFIDDAGIKTVTLTVKFPYYATQNFNIDSGLFSIQITDRFSVLSSANVFENMEIQVGNSASFTTSENNVSLASYYSENWESINCYVNLKFENHNYTLNFSNIQVARSFLSIENISDNIQGRGHIMINAMGSSVHNKTIIVPQGVTSLVYQGSALRLKNIKFKFEARETLYLYLFDFNVESTTDTAVLDLRSVNNVYVHVGGMNEIVGFASNYLIEAQSITFSGDGNLFVRGNDGLDGNSGNNQVSQTAVGESGLNGEDGKSGTNGVSALTCTYINRTQSVSVVLEGGNGGNGGKGGIGGKGGPGKHADNHGEVGINGGNGGRGGNGGNGGNGGKACSIEANLPGIIARDGAAGRGGDGGRGGNGGAGANGVCSLITSTNYTSLPGSDGGNGGNGGNAGISGSGNLKPGISHPKGGNGGLGGKGGNGAAVSFATNGNFLSLIYTCVDACNGGNGGDGGYGYYGGNGGVGGSGGKGANGSDGSITQKVGNGHPGGKSGNGGNGGNSSSSDANAGQGGRGRSGGSGGDPGQPIIQSNAGSPGPVGEPGEPGQPGRYVDPNSSCIAAGTLITLADGRRVPVETLTGNELLLVWNLQTGKFDVAPILFIDHDSAREYEVVNLTFSDGTKVKVISEHGFWDYDLNEYVFLRKDAAKYIGHWFNKQTTDADGNLSWKKVKLESVTITTEVTTAWSPVTYGHLCYYVNGMLSMPGATTGLINIFDVDPETMKIDEDKYASDIAKYGLFTYEEFAAIYPVPEVIFEAFGGKYLKVAMGKGLLTDDMLESLIARYSVFFEA